MTTACWLHPERPAVAVILADGDEGRCCSACLETVCRCPECGAYRGLAEKCPRCGHDPDDDVYRLAAKPLTVIEEGRG